MRNKQKLLVQLLVVIILVGTIWAIRFTRGIPPALEREPAKIKGNPAASVSLVQFVDFTCPHSRRLQPILNSLLQMFPTDLNVVFKHFIIYQDSTNSLAAAQASECAGEQGMFFEYSDLLFLNPDIWFSEDNRSHAGFDLLAMKLGLDVGQFNECLMSGKMKEKLFRNQKEGERYFVDRTPSCLLNGKEMLLDPFNLELVKMKISKEIQFSRKHDKSK